jgi:hypothetical protein
VKNQKIKTNSKIPPPPPIEAGYQAIIDYHTKYSMDELEQAGYLEDPSPEEVEGITASADFEFLCKNGLHLGLSRKDYEQLSLLAARLDIDVEKLVKKWIRQRLHEESRIVEKQVKCLQAKG